MPYSTYYLDEEHRSKNYLCLKCGGPIYIFGSFASDEEYGDVFHIEITCPKCQDTRYGDVISDVNDEIQRLLKYLGSTS